MKKIMMNLLEEPDAVAEVKSWYGDGASGREALQKSTREWQDWGGRKGERGLKCKRLLLQSRIAGRGLGAQQPAC